MVLVDNGMYGTIRMHQEREFPARDYRAALLNPDFRELSLAFGAHAETVARTEDFAVAFERAMQANRDGDVAVIVLRIDPEALTINQTLTQIRQQAMGRVDGPARDGAAGLGVCSNAVPNCVQPTVPPEQAK